MFWGLFIEDDYVVVYPFSNFSLRCQMAPLQSIKFQTADFPIFCARIIVIFWTACTGMEGFSVVVMGNWKCILPVLQCLEVGIAFVSSIYIYYQQDCPKSSSAGIVFTHGPILGVFRPAGATRCTDQGEIWPAPPWQILPWSAPGLGLRPQKL